MSIVDDILIKEGPPTNDPQDPGGRTALGISERAHPEAWLDGHVTYEEARTIYLHDYVVKPGFDRVSFAPLREQLIDFGVNAGPTVAIKLLQSHLGLVPDGVLGPLTLEKLVDPKRVNNILVLAREQWYRALCVKRPDLKKFLKGWLKRAHSFYLP